MLRIRRLAVVAIVFCIAAWAGASAAPAEDPVAWLGVRIVGAGDGVAGARIWRVMLDSPAERAGLRAGDVILSINGSAVDGPSSLIERIRGQSVGGWASLQYRRGDDERDADARLAARPAKGVKLRSRDGWVGLEAIELPPALRVHFGAPEEAGVMISAVVPGSPAEVAGVRLGDVVYAFEEREVTSTRDLGRLFAGAGVGNRKLLQLMRDGVEIEVETRIDVDPAIENRRGR